MKFHKITARGIAEIRAYLEEHTKITPTDSRVQEWAAELASAMDEGKYEIEIAAQYTHSRRPQHLSVSSAGFEMVEESRHEPSTHRGQRHPSTHPGTV